MGNSDNGTHYQADVYYLGWDSKLNHSYTYDAYIFIDEPVFTAPDKFHLDKKAKFEGHKQYAKWRSKAQISMGSEQGRRKDFHRH